MAGLKKKGPDRKAPRRRRSEDAPGVEARAVNMMANLGQQGWLESPDAAPPEAQAAALRLARRQGLA